jgi:hypothetical protein
LFQIGDWRRIFITLNNLMPFNVFSSDQLVGETDVTKN